MVYLDEASTYMEQSILLLQARPTTTRISTRYKLSPPQRSKAATGTSAGGGASESDAAAAVPRARGVLVLKTYDPVSGACLKYRTSKQAEIGRLVAAMGRCARVMANVALEKEEEEAAQEPAITASAQEKEKAGGQQQQQGNAPAAGGAGGGGGGKKKKKGKK